MQANSEGKEVLFKHMEVRVRFVCFKAMFDERAFKEQAIISITLSNGSLESFLLFLRKNKSSVI